MSVREWEADFLAALALRPNVTEACREAGITRQGAYQARASDPEFAARWQNAIDESTDELVGEVYDRAKAGSDTLAIFLLKCHRRDVYGDKVQTDHAGGVVIRVEYEDAEAPPPAPGPEGLPP